FEFVTDNFMQNTMLDMGEHAEPAFLDYNNDSLMDLVIATRANPTGGYLTYGINRLAYDHLELYENIGTKEKAVYKKVDDDFASMKKYKLTFLAPAFADLDGDGRPDMLIGSKSGKVMYFKNMGDSENTIQWKLISDSLPNVQASGHSTPCLAHIGNDSLFDLVMGCDTGKYSYFKNAGTKTSPQFKLVTREFGKINLDSYWWEATNWDSNGNPIDSTIEETFVWTNPAVADMDHNGKPDLISGSTNEDLHFYSNITDNLSGAFIRTDTVIYNTLKHAKEYKNVGYLPMPAAADLDND